MKRGAPAKDVDSYLAALPEAQRAALDKLRKTIRAAAPKAEEAISYQIPVFKYHGPLVFFAGFRDHCSLFVPGKALVKSLQAELKPFKTSGATIRFSPEHPLPAALVRKIVKARVSENERRQKGRNKST